VKTSDFEVTERCNLCGNAITQPEFNSSQIAAEADFALRDRLINKLRRRVFNIPSSVIAYEHILKLMEAD